MRNACETITRRVVSGLGVLAAVAAIGAFAAGVTAFKPSPASASTAAAQKTGKPCGTCHTKAPELNGAGKKYKSTGKL